MFIYSIIVGKILTKKYKFKRKLVNQQQKYSAYYKVVHREIVKYYMLIEN